MPPKRAQSKRGTRKSSRKRKGTASKQELSESDVVDLTGTGESAGAPVDADTARTRTPTPTLPSDTECADTHRNKKQRSAIERADTENISMASKDSFDDLEANSGWEDANIPDAPSRQNSADSWDDLDGFGQNPSGSGWDDMCGDDEAPSSSLDLIPAAIKKMVADDLTEAQLLSRYTVHADTSSGTRIRLRVGFEGSLLNIGKEQARAWAVDTNKMVVADVNFPPHYLATQLNDVQVKVGQADSIQDTLTGFSLSWTLEKRLKKDLIARCIGRDVLPARPYSFDDVQRIIECTASEFPVALQVLKDCKGSVSEAINSLLRSTTLNRNQLKRHISDSKKKEEEEEVKMTISTDARRLMDIFGASAEVAELALANCCGNMDDASVFLSDPEARSQLQDIVKTSSAHTADEKGPTLQPNLDDPMQRITLSILNKHNIITKMASFLEAATKSCHKHCVVCGSELEFYGLKPCICDRTLCKMGFEDLGLGFDLGSQIVEHGSVVDLLISSAFYACQAKRMHFVTPINVTGVDAEGKEIGFRVHGAEGKAIDVDVKQLQLNGEDLASKYLDHAKVLSVLGQCPSIAKMQKWVKKGLLEEKLKAIDPLLYPLLRWILASNRAHIRELKPAEQSRALKTEFQFVLLQSSPEKEARFTQLKRAAELHRGESNGSIFTYHGSNNANWHSILRTGLKNMSNTKYMTAGAAFGAGIYMAENAQTSIGYSARGQGPGWENSMFGPNFSYLAVCEVVNHKDLKKPNPHYVVEQEDWVTTR